MALVIVMVSIGALIDGGVVALRSAKASTQHEKANALARSILAEQSLRLIAGDRSGDAGDGFRWHAAIRPVGAIRVVPDGAPPDAIRSAPEVTMFSVRVDVRWRDGAGSGVEQIETRRLATGFPQG